MSGGVVISEGPYHEVISGGVAVDGAKDGEGVVEGSGDDEGGGFVERVWEGGAVDEARLDEVRVHLVQVPAGPALLQDHGFRVLWEVRNEGYGGWGFGG